MATSKKRPKPTPVEVEIKAFNPTKSKVGKIIILILAIGFVASIFIAAVMLMVDYFSSL
ncbi:MAG: hypothetical protein WC509_03015 [Candidatus Izemoplasmatales bacterium]